MVNSTQYNSLNRSGVFNSNGQGGGVCSNVSSLDETLQVVKDMLSIKRNQSQSNIQIVQNNNNNHSQIGLNSSVLFDRNNHSTNVLNESRGHLNFSSCGNQSSGFTIQKKPPIRYPQTITHQNPANYSQGNFCMNI